MTLAEHESARSCSSVLRPRVAPSKLVLPVNTHLFADALALLLSALACSQAADCSPSASWKIGTPIVTSWAGPPMPEAAAQQMAEGGWNLVWCSNTQELDVAHRKGLRGLLTNGLFAPATLDDPDRRGKL